MFVILVFLGVSMYVYLRGTIINGIDQALEDRARLYSSSEPRLPGVITALPISRINRNIQLLMWNEDQTLVGNFLADQYSGQMIELLRSSLLRNGPFHIRLNGETFRVLNITISDTYPTPVGLQPKAGSGSLQIVTNISSEMNMLNTVLGFIIVGICLAAAISIMAGLYLANRALIPIRSSWDKQQQFIADASHELRTPLAVLQTHTELLLRHPDHTIEQDSREISTILKEIHRMKKLVNGLLTLAQTDADRLELQMKPLRLDLIVEIVYRQFLPLAAMKEIELTSQLDTSVIVQGDEERLQQLIMIVIDNAIKYTPNQGRIHVHCKKTDSTVSIMVKDSGIGIAADDLPHIFERFYRGDKVRGRTEGGTGLGLAIANWIVARHAGKIVAESKRHEGTAITIMLPLV